jgi:epoxyqueuosine reductase
VTGSFKHEIVKEAHRLGFVLAGVTIPDPPAHFSTFEQWLANNHHGDMAYLATERSLLRRANPKEILPECKSILVLGTPYRPAVSSTEANPDPSNPSGRIAAYALGDDYHDVLPPRLESLVAFIEGLTGHTIAHRCYTDTGPLLERDLAQRAGLGWIGKNTCLIHPQKGSFFLLAEILLDLELEPDPPFATDHCGTCTRCIDACPTDAILPGRTIDARRCISYLTIENKDDIPEGFRSQMQDWIFGCDICQQVCPWNRFAAPDGDASFQPPSGTSRADLIPLLSLSPEEFNQRFKRSPIRRAKRRGLLRNASVALGNVGGGDSADALETASEDPEAIIREHAKWAREQVSKRARGQGNKRAREQEGKGAGEQGSKRAREQESKGAGEQGSK